MDQIKKVNYLRDNPAGSFPDVEQVPPKEVQRLRDRISTLVRAEGTPDGPELIKTIRTMSTALEACDANASDFSIREVLAERGLHPTAKVYLNWGPLERLDRMFLDDLDKLFPYIWYPASDDIEVFDHDAKWILSVAHDGTVMILA